MTPILWHVELTTHRSTCFTAYVQVVARGCTVKVERLLDAAGAARLNRDDKMAGRPFPWEAGTTTQRFDDADDALNAAVTAWSFIAEPRDALIQGLHGEECPPWNVDVIAGPSGFVDAAKALSARAEAAGWYDHGRSGDMKLIEAAWRSLLDSFELRSFESPKAPSQTIVLRHQGESSWAPAITPPLAIG